MNKYIDASSFLQHGRSTYHRDETKVFDFIVRGGRRGFVRQNAFANVDSCAQQFASKTLTQTIAG